MPENPTTMNVGGFGTSGSIPMASSAPTTDSSQDQQSVNYAGAAMSSIDKILERNQEELNKAAVAASTPIAGSMQGAIPSSLQPHNRVPQLGELDHREVVGRGNARAQGIGNSIIGVSNFVNKVSAAVENKRSKEIADATQQLMELQQGIDQAQMIKPEQGAEAYAQAQKVIQANTQRQQTILSDNRIRKAIQKGMKIDFTDPQENNTTEHKGVLLGRRKAEEAAKQRTLQRDPQFFAKQFQQGQPQGMVPNVPAMQRYQMLAQTQKNLVDMQKALSPVLSAYIHAGATVRAKEIGELAMNAREQARLINQWNIAQAKIQAAAGLVKLKFGYTLSLQRNHMQDTLKMQEELFDYKAGSAFSFNQKANAMMKQFDGDINQTTNTLNNLLAARDKAAADKHTDPKELDDYDRMIQAQKDMLATISANKLNTQKQIEQFQKVVGSGGGINAGGDGSDSSGGESGSGESNVDPNSVQFWGSDEAEKLVESSNQQEGNPPQ